MLQASATALPVMHALLNLAEYMERQSQPFTISDRFLAEQSSRINVHAKALYFLEKEFFQEPSYRIVAALIGVNEKLQQSDAACGMLELARKDLGFDPQETHSEEWFEKLGRWQDALNLYDGREGADNCSRETTMGKMRCLHALGEWDHLASLVRHRWASFDSVGKSVMAPLAAAAAWNLNTWDDMETYINAMKTETSTPPEYSFYQAVLAAHREKYEEGERYVIAARDAIDPEFKETLEENYERSYSVFVRAQTLSELEEVLSYKRYPDPLWQAKLRQTWTKRLDGCQKDVEVWQRILQVRALVLNPAQDMKTWAKFGNLCRKAGRLPLAEKLFDSLLGPDIVMDEQMFVTSRAPIEVIYAKLKLTWEFGANDRALRVQTITNLRDFANLLAADLTKGTRGLSDKETPQALQQFKESLARCYYRLGKWQIAMRESWVMVSLCQMPAV